MGAIVDRCEVLWIGLPGSSSLTSWLSLCQTMESWGSWQCAGRWREVEGAKEEELLLLVSLLVSLLLGCCVPRPPPLPRHRDVALWKTQASG